MFYFQPGNPQCPPHTPNTDPTSHNSTPAKTIDISLTAVTFNAQTLRTDTPSGRKHPNAPKSFRHQFQDYGAHIVALQEARTHTNVDHQDG